jgi:bacillithiol biosynthesis cysteine-adding enzyme BshC
MDTMQWINYTDFPRSEGGFSQLYRDYINDFHKVEHYFETDFHSLDTLGKYAHRLTQRIRHRSILVEVLLEQNQQFGIGEAAINNIYSLADDNTFAIVTGQQVGMLTGPMYTIYKTITTIKLAKHLATIYPDYKFVPIFWLEGEDHDFEEVNKINVLNSDNTPTCVEYLPNGKPVTKNLGAVGEIGLDDYINMYFDTLEKTLGNSEYRQPLIELLKSAYFAGTNINQSFALLMNKLFEGEGLVFISSNDKRLKQLLSPLFLKELSEFPRVSQLIIEQSAELEDNYHAQIKTKALNLFHLSKGGRYFIEPREDGFSLKGSKQHFTKDELLEIATNNPELLSPNVALRPICQDTILPTLVYVAGPAEIAYFAQLKKVYRHFDLTMPMIYPRASITLVEEKLERMMDKYQLELIEFFEGSDKINRRVIDNISEIKIDDMFAEINVRIADLTNEMRFGLNYIDSTLLGALENTRLKIEQQFSTLKEKVIEAQKRKHETGLRQIAKVVNSILPNKNYQERELNIIHFMNKHGLDFAHSLQSVIEIDQFKHQIIRL